MSGREGIPGIDYLDDCADAVLIQCQSMPKPCIDCAFTPGTSAAEDTLTAIQAAECVEARHPFWCHKTMNELDICTHLCAGWVARVQPTPATVAADRGGRDGSS